MNIRVIKNCILQKQPNENDHHPSEELDIWYIILLLQQRIDYFYTWNAEARIIKFLFKP
jgi:hypothetical protein